MLDRSAAFRSCLRYPARLLRRVRRLRAKSWTSLVMYGVPPNAPHLLAVTFDAKEARACIYIDGKLAASLSLDGGPNHLPAGALEVAGWGERLSPDELADLWAAAAGKS